MPDHKGGRLSLSSIEARHLIWVGVITLLALALRLYKIGDWSFWGDEMITVMRALGRSGIEPLPRLSVSLTAVAFDLWGVSEWSARIPAALFGALTIPVVYFGARRMYDPSTGLLAALFLAISIWHIYWSQNARFYSTLLFFYTLALFFFHFGLEKDRPGYFMLSLGFLAIALLESLTAAFLIPIVFTYIILIRVLPFEKPAGLRPRNILIFFGPFFIAALYFAAQNILARETWQSTFWFFDFAYLNNSSLWILAGVVYYLGLPLVSMAAVGALYLVGRRDRRALLLTLGAVIPVASIMVISLFQYSANRYTFVATTSAIILAAAAVRELFRHVAVGGKLLALGVLLILVAAPMSDGLLYYRYQNGNRDNWKEAFAWIEEHKEADDLVITAQRDLADYYLQEPTTGTRYIDIQQLAASGRRLWFVLDLTAPTKAPHLVSWFERNALHMASMDVTVHARIYPMRIYLYDPSP